MSRKLINIQNELKVPKNQFNSFGKYKYRNAEDILEAIKPLLLKHECALFLSDSIETKEGRFYVKATATFIDSENNKVEITAYAREEESKKGMDGSQVTGAASSYARKYALNGLFLIDDTKDADYNNNENQNQPQKKQVAKKPVLTENSEKWQSAIDYIVKGKTIEDLKKYYDLTKENEKLLLDAVIDIKQQELQNQ